MHKVDFSKVKQLLKSPKKLPQAVRKRALHWGDQVEIFGLKEIQKVPNFKDHSLKRDRKGQRAISLDYQWRLIYEVNKSGQITIVTVEEITPHDYRRK